MLGTALDPLLAAESRSGIVAYHRGDYADALPLLQRLAQGGDTSAHYRLGIMYRYGKGVAQDLDRARTEFRIAADRGDARAQFSLGKMAEADVDSPNRFIEATMWYRMAAAEGMHEAQAALGYVLALGGHGIERDQEEAADWFLKAAQQGDADAETGLGLLLRSAGCPDNALTWFRAAARQGDGLAADILANIYDSGIDVLADPTEAMQWRIMAAEHGEADSQVRLAWSYLDGRHGPVDRVQAYRWFTIVLRGTDGSTASMMDSARDIRDVIGAMMPDEQVAQAERLAQTWVSLAVPASIP